MGESRRQVDETIVWACLAFSILSADLILQWQEQARSHTLYPTTNGHLKKARE